MSLVLTTRKILGVYRNAKGEPLPNKRLKIELLRDLFAGGNTIPQQETDIIMSNLPGHLGEYEATLYTIVGFALPYRITLDNKNSHRFALAPGAAIPIDALMSLSAIVDPPPVSLELELAMESIATAAVLAHEQKVVPHQKYETENLLLIYQTGKL